MANTWAGGFTRYWSVSQFGEMETWLKRYNFFSWRPKFVVLHNTGSPTLKRWLETDELQRIKNLEHFYRDIQKWSSGPHFFVSPTRIFEGTPFDVPGTHSPSWNHLSIGIEMAGDYETEPFDPHVRINTVKLLSIIHKILGLDPAKYQKGVHGLHFHKEDPKTTHRICPGKNVVKDSIVKDIESEMRRLDSNSGEHNPTLIKGETPSDEFSGNIRKAQEAVEAHKAAVDSLLHDTSIYQYRGVPTESVDLSARTNFPANLGDAVLRSGSTATIVKTLQQILQGYGYLIKADGMFGPATDSAVRDFQKKANLAVDGEVGLVTARVLSDGTVSPHPKEVPFPNDPSIPVPSPRLVDSQPMWVVVGMSLLNTEEGPGSEDNPEILEWAKEEGGDIAKVYKHDSIPWCALLANYILTKVGLPGTGTLWALDFLTTKSLVTLQGPCVGAFAPMKREHGGHITVVVGRDPYGNLMCLGGNQNDSVSIEPFPRGRPLSFRWPKGVTLPKNIGFDTLPLVDSDGKVSIKED
jgi:uncharacterized protein (TIGR02594 family)